MAKRIWIVILVLSVFLFVPSVANAAESNEVVREDETIEERSDRLLGNRAAGPMQSIRDFFYRVRVKLAGSSFGLNQLGVVVPAFLRINARMLYLVPVTLVFLWWGVRKTKNIIMTAFRTGRLSFGDRKVRDRNSYYYGTRPSDWR